MRSRMSVGFAVVGLSAALFLAFSEARPRTMASAPLDAGPSRGCGAGCAVISDLTPHLEPSKLRELLSRWSVDPAGETLALDTLLFHADAVASFFASRESEGLSEAQADFLRREISRRSATVSVRVVDDLKRCRFTLVQTVPLGEKQHGHPPDADGLTPPELSFTVKRVGLHHLWTRI